jgi:hypothetical protein
MTPTPQQPRPNSDPHEADVDPDAQPTEDNPVPGSGAEDPSDPA